MTFTYCVKLSWVLTEMLIILSNSNTCGPTKSNTKYCGKRGQQMRTIPGQADNAWLSILCYCTEPRWDAGGAGGQWLTKQNSFLVPDVLLPRPRLVFYSIPCMAAQDLLHKCPWASVCIRRYCQKGQEAQGNPKDLLVLGIVLVSFVTNWNKHMSRKGWKHEIVEKGVEMWRGVV